MSFVEVISPIEEIIEEARNGRMFILVDDEDRENEGDLVIPAQMATPEAINFMAKHGRGLVCLALSRQRCEELRLPLMAQHNASRLQTAFTVSIEARDGVTTGISAPDRARTVAAAARLAGRLEAITDLPGEQADRLLQSVPGIGPWTAAEVRQRACGDADAVSVGDYHIPGQVGWVLAGEPGDDDRMLELLAPYAGQRYRVTRLIELSGQGPPRRGPRMSMRDYSAI